MKRSRRRRCGSSVLEFTLLGIPMVFVLISVFEMARGMWVYHSLAYAVKEATRFTIVKGQNCAIAPNACTVTVQQIARVLADRAGGLPAEELNITLTSLTDTRTCNPLSTCLAAGATPWPTLTTPPNFGSNPGNNIQITATFRFRSAISLLWPGNNPGIQFGDFLFGATSMESIQF